MLGAGSGGSIREVEVGTADCASVAEGTEACSVQDCEDVPSIWNLGAVAGGDYVLVVEGVMRDTAGKAEESGAEESWKSVEISGWVRFISELRDMYEEARGLWLPSGEKRSALN